MDTADRRRYGIIETRFRQYGALSMYNLTINGELWACVEWSAGRRAWCIQDASGRCLAHCDAIHGQDIDAQTAVALAKRMVIDGRMPTPEDAARKLRQRLKADARARDEADPFGLPSTLLPEPEPVLVVVDNKTTRPKQGERR